MTMVPTARTWAEIDLGAFRENLVRLRRAVGPSVAVAAVVKADAYGHGAVRVGAEALKAGCRLLVVGELSEAAELRDAGLTGPILVLGPLAPGEEDDAVRLGLRLTVQDKAESSRLAEAARRIGARARVHLKVDTGMHRLGAAPEEAVGLARDLAAAPELELEGLLTHLACASMLDESFTAGQLAAFRLVLDRLAADGIRPVWVHAANSAAAFRFPASRFDLVRAGIALYGVDPGAFARMGVTLSPVLSLRTRVAALRTIEPGDSVGYDQRFRAARRTRVAVLPVGYYDGYPHRLSNRGVVLIGRRRARVIGSVTMDYTMIDVTDLPDIAIGHPVTLFGRDGEATLRLEELAHGVGTIPYELTCRLGRRVRRVYRPARTEQEAAA
jgi:alanine racemase